MADGFLGDGYGRLRGTQTKWRREVAQSGSLVFIDVDAGEASWPAVAGWFRGLPDALLVSTFTLLVRLPESLLDPSRPEEIVQSLGTRGHDIPNVGVVGFAVGEQPTVMWAADEGQDNGRYLQRARRIELWTLLQWGDAIWRPDSYHYRLPSGHHASSFIRVADAFRDPRAAAALATWLYPAVESGTTLVVDSGTLTPIVSELRASARDAGIPILSVSPMDEYPVSRYEYRSALESTGQTTVLALVSVSSTGRMYSELVHVLQETVGSGWRAERLVSRRADEAEASSYPLGPVIRSQAPWLNLADLQPAFQPGISACSLCRDPKRARVVYVHPRNYAAMFPPESNHLMPSIGDGRRNASLWNLYDGLIKEDGSVADTTISFRGPTRPRPYERGQRDGIFFEPAALAFANDFTRTVSERIGALQRLPKNSPTDKEPKQIAASLNELKGFDLIVFDREDLDSLSRIQQNLVSGAEPPDVVAGRIAGTIAELLDGEAVFHVMDEQQPDPRQGLDKWVDCLKGNRVLAVTMGLKNGTTIQRLLVEIHDSWRNKPQSPEVKGLVIHAHPDEARVWDGVRNAFRSSEGIPRLVALWLTYLPKRSPIQEEQATLRQFPTTKIAALSDTAQRLLKERLDVKSETLLWSGSPSKLRRTSYYGDALTEWAVMAAVGAAMHRTRQESSVHEAPNWVDFDLSHTLRSYFDGLIHASVLRWLLPHEGWWGPDGDSCSALLLEIEQRAPDDWKLLLPELLLAAVQGKLPSDGMTHLVTAADDQLTRREWPERVLGFVELGHALVQDALSNALSVVP